MLWCLREPISLKSQIFRCSSDSNVRRMQFRFTNNSKTDQMVVQAVLYRQEDLSEVEKRFGSGGEINNSVADLLFYGHVENLHKPSLWGEKGFISGMRRIYFVLVTYVLFSHALLSEHFWRLLFLKEKPGIFDVGTKIRLACNPDEVSESIFVRCQTLGRCSLWHCTGSWTSKDISTRATPGRWLGVRPEDGMDRVLSAYPNNFDRQEQSLIILFDVYTTYLARHSRSCWVGGLADWSQHVAAVTWAKDSLPSTISGNLTFLIQVQKVERLWTLSDSGGRCDVGPFIAYGHSQGTS